MLELVTPIAVAAGSVILVFDRFGLLERFGPKKLSVADASAELTIADRTIDRLRDERNRARDVIRQLEHTNKKLEEERSLEPVLQLVAHVAEICAQTLEKLASFNGSLRHIDEGLGLTVEGMKTLTGVIAELHDLPLHPPKRES